MKKNLKGLAALWLALIMVLTLVPVVSADSTHVPEHLAVGGGMENCWVWYSEEEPHWDMVWNNYVSGGIYIYVPENGIATLPNHPRICEEDAVNGWAWIFRGWEIWNGTGEFLSGGAQVTNEQVHEIDGGDENCNGEIDLLAAFDYGIKVDVISGTGDGYYAAGEDVTITADTISGKRFKKWEVKAAQANVPRPCALDAEGEIIEDENSYIPELEGFDETAATTTFVMPGDDCWLTFTATYEDAPVTPSKPSFDWYIPAPTEPETEECWKVNCSKLNVRKAPSLFSGVITKLERDFCIKDGELVEDGKWVRFEVEEGVYGYVSADYAIACDCLDNLVLPMEKQVVCRKLNVRSGAGTSFGKLGQLTRGETVKIVSCDCSGWVEIEYNGGYAWICAAYIG